MTKAREIEILREAIAQLGPDSYLGPVLEQQLPFIEQELRSDHTPVGILNTIHDAWRSLKETDEALARGREALAKQETERARLRMWFDAVIQGSSELSKKASEVDSNTGGLLQLARKLRAAA